VMQQAKQPFGIRLQLLARLTLNAREHTGNQPARLLSSTTAMIMLFWSRATRDLLKACPGAGRGGSAGASRHSIAYMRRRSCHFLAARPIASLGPASRRGASRLVATPASITSPPIKTIGIAPFAARIACVKGLVAATSHPGSG
jgi:hypothetical protein